MQEQLAAGVSALHAVKVAFIDMDGSPLISTAAASCLAGCRSRRHSIALGCPGLLHPRREARPALEATWCVSRARTARSMMTPYQVPTRIRATKNCAANATPAHALLPLSRRARCAPALWPAGQRGAARRADGQAARAHWRHVGLAAQRGPSCRRSRTAPGRQAGAASACQARLSRLCRGTGAAVAGAGAGTRPRRRTGACA